MTETLIGFAAFIALSFLRVPLALSMGIVGFAGFAWLVNVRAALAMSGQVAYETGFSYTLSVIPLFILMGNFIVKAKLAEEIYKAAYAFVGHRRGGLAISTVLASGLFGSVCGSALATTATFTKIGGPSMRSFGYKDSLIAGTLASSGTLGILIPPSIVLVLYGIMTGESIGRLFIAGIVPGILAVIVLCLVVMITVRYDPAAGPRGERQDWPTRLRSLRRVWPVVLLFCMILGGIYAGVFTATEGAGIGAGGAFLFALTLGRMGIRDLLDVLIESGRTTAVLFLIMIGAFMFANFVNLTTMPSDLVAFIKWMNMSPMAVVLTICAIYILLGMAMEELSMIALTVPLFYPVVTGIGYDGIWFGVMVVMVCMIGLTTPPVGICVFVVKTLLPNLKLGDAFRGTWTFNAALVLLLLRIIAVPEIPLFLTQYMR